ncbi:cation efflux protein, CzcI family [Janthinobacterium lividum]|uniref:Cobalt-zinc-cadmium resistance protein CzcI n=1 Tax=Janthinobacterium lividum TaxID=29581 RepID=A0ABU0XVF4_9BURK|nr:MULTISPECIES: cation efflux protein, CzcI family [Janthinobacterium]MDQ4627526.1 hypothetical protein [Janthinobacterium lividum]MDQ4675754.1 hypothetical protein [Janthinobacterium lividum]MDQ4686484.1 hypothetical protein [Janthinobacterium lividum]SDH33230.1 hypothetical protein SAMN05428968_2975 [Janthinobacterium sp. YR213]
MRRFFLILLLFVLPLQMSWAAASAYCLHEEGKAAQHLGHHSHQHKAEADADKQPFGDKKVADQQKKGQPHSDCNVCHGIGHAWLPAGSSLPVGDTASVNADTSPFFYASHIPDAPKRPDWSSAT